MLEAVVSDGTGEEARVTGYRIAGKTGTAQRAVNGTFDDSHHVAWFAGFLGQPEPRVVVVVAVEDPDTLSKQVSNAGAIFLGHYTPVAVGDYLAGPNHVLPTGGTARFASPLGVEDFLKRTSVTRFEPPKLRELGLDVMRLAEMEGLGGHGRSVDLRLQKIRRARREREAAREAEAELEL